MVERMNDQFPVLQGHRTRMVDAQKVDHVRRLLRRAFEQGALCEEEFAITLERLELAIDLPAPTLASPARRSARSKGSA